MSKHCLVCLRPLSLAGDFHPKCSRDFFGTYPAPGLEISLKDLREYAARSVLARIAVPGVQKKLSLGTTGKGRNARFTIIGLWGKYILKPPSEEYPHLPENEDAVMRLAECAGIPSVPHAFVRLSSGELSFICKRIDRTASGEKLAMEDFCQISERLTEDKYKGSLERVGRLLLQYSTYPGLDAVDFFERALFCFFTGNSDMHLKNHSLIETSAGMRLSPAYDLLSTAIVIPEDKEETALTINGKKSNLTRNDFDRFAESLEIPASAVGKVYRNFLAKQENFLNVLHHTFLPKEAAGRLEGILEKRLAMFRQR
jgi:serine/threonine-protein kinase HipA